MMVPADNTKQILPAVAAAIFNDRGEILLQKRGDVNKWCILSGHVEFGETIEEALLREIEEETNSPARIIRLIGVYSSPDSQTYFYDDRTVHYITSYFEAQLMSDLQADFSNSETKELRFFNTHALPEDLALLNSNWLADALSKRETPFIR